MIVVAFYCWIIETPFKVFVESLKTDLDAYGFAIDLFVLGDRLGFLVWSFKFML